MAEVEEECTFHTRADQVKFFTQTNGDKIRIINLALTQAQATSMTWLVNADDNVELEFQVKIKGA
ncbi:unnamed protein product [marine sediment metagenome]|uniref:Uncharacterized protein n=1 Tax=marine sediment metagenome TaxID=412755 RepID=X1DBC2_9ZZZZ